MYRGWFLIFAAANAFAAGPLIIGGRGGAGLTNVTSGALGALAGNTFGHTYSIGPTVGVRLPLHFSLEGDALYNRRNLGLGLAGIGGIETAADWWEFPVMVKFSPGKWAVAPVVGAGVSVQHILNFGGVPQYLLSGSTSANSVGFVAAGGAQFRLGRVAVTPELRYTRWSSTAWKQALVDVFTGGRDQVQLIVGVTF